MKLRIALALGAALLAMPIAAQERPDGRVEGKAAVRADDAAIPPPTVSVTRHSGTFGGTRINYRAIAGDTYLKDKDGKPLASITSYSYIKEGPVDPKRPVTFLWNGGPGSGSLWLHMGAFGPRRVVIPSDARDDGAPPYPIVDNPDSLLDVTDIVFIDPVGTGFSRALGTKDPKDYWGVTKDAKSMAEFIRLWLNANGRWNAPKFIGGESYGTTRSAAVINELEGAGFTDVSINGILLISSILDFSAAADSPGNELGYVTNLPSMAATAWYHNKVANRPATVEEFVAEAKAFAIGPYAIALLKGNALTAAERQQVLPQLSRFTGVSQEYLARADLRLSPGRFYKELLRDRGQTIGRLDTRYLGKDYDDAGEEPDNDPSFYAIDGAYTAAMNQHSREFLNYSPDLTYSSIGGVRDWDWKIGGPRGGEGYLNVAPYIGRALRENSGLRVFVGQGYYDFATPFFGAEYSLNRTGIPNDGRISWHWYHAGHMMYVRDEDLRKLSSDIRGFIRAR
ncbi:peptidase S10 [Sphingomonas sp. NBWT7]|uniref:S10 family peptidase n=1 Tax=Sphingomonas sp. NBWT7 TaxID=2596913 RepID=UPI001628560A|nr:peptidase S10 [Sphingomonas sp. NBWT7]QNE30711.1 peptidase S10 [Sphingomonas sp. NBWT7]